MMGIGLFDTLADKERLKKLRHKKIDLLKKYYAFKEHEHVLLELLEELKELDCIRIDALIDTDFILKRVNFEMEKFESEINVDVDFKGHQQFVNKYRYFYHYSDDKSSLTAFEISAPNLHEAGLKFAKFAKEEAIKAGKHGVVVDRVDFVEQQNLEMEK